MRDIITVLCSRCRKPVDTVGRYCRACRAEYMREWRASRVTISRETLQPLIEAANRARGKEAAE
jgi:predicted amidophosphoribosyltransferase